MLTPERSLLGVRFSAGLLVVWGFALCLQSAAFIFLTGMSAFAPHHHARPNLETALAEAAFILVPGIAGIFCFRAANGLTTERAWAASYASILGAVLVIGGLSLTIDQYRHPPRDDYVSDFAIALIFVIWPSVLAGLWWCVYLNLPHVRRRLKRRKVTADPSLRSG